MAIPRGFRLGCCVLLIARVSAASGPGPETVSPGEEARFALIEGRCPTFSWAQLEGARRYELVVYRVRDEGRETRPVVRRVVSGSASSWTPSLDRCLERGGRYAWSVRARGTRDVSAWSPLGLFEVAAAPDAVELQAALETVRRHLSLAGRTLPEGTVEATGETAAPRSPASVSSPVPEAVGTTQLEIDGGVVASSFTGDGSTLTALNPANLSTGSAGIDISGTAATASDLVCVDCVAESELDFDPATQTELTAHGNSGSAHHEPPTALPPSGPAGGDLTGSYPNPSASDSLARDSEVTSAVAAHAAIGSAHHDARRPLYYLDLGTGGFDGLSVFTACDTGFHFASIYEIVDPSNLIYDTSRGATTDDSGSGPPQGAFGWIRTGDISGDQNDVGFANCGDDVGNPWVSNDAGSYGTHVWFEDPLAADWNSPASRISPWSAGTTPCHITLGVWCVEDAP